MNHEQYHFNITEFHARLLNEYIRENPDGTEHLFLLRLGSLNIDLRDMQRQYDNETGHSQVFDKQRRWEFKIDSLLHLESGWVTDHFSGAKVYFSATPDSVKGITKNARYRKYFLQKYGMYFGLTSFYNDGISRKTLAENIHEVAKKSYRLNLFSLDTAEMLKSYAITTDSDSYTNYGMWIQSVPYIYYVEAQFPNNSGDTTGFSQIATSFINSFHITNTDNYWIQKLESSSPINFYEASKHGGTKDEKTQYCISKGLSRQAGFYRGPFYRDDGALILAYDYLIHADTLHFSDVLLLNKNWYMHVPSPEGQIFFIPAKNIPKKKYAIDFGYILRQDSAKECYDFYYENLQVAP